MLIFVALFIMAYIPVTIIVTKNVNILGGYKYLFSLTALPVFLIGMTFNFWVFDKYFHEAFQYLIRDNPECNWGRGCRAKTMVVAVPVGLLLAFIWYKTLFHLSRINAKANRGA
jgi:hypothetical protein